MAEELATVDPFAPQEAGAKTKFGKLKLIANPVTLTSGASYTVKGVHDREGNTKEWRGKKLDKASKRFHIIAHLICKDKQGNEYETMRDHLNSDKPYTNIMHPSLVKVFGESAKFPRESYVFVQVEEVATGESFQSTRDTNEDGTPKSISKTTFKVVKKFANEAACKTAETEYFARFTNGNGATDGGDGGAAPDVPDGWDSDAWENAKGKIRKALAAGKSAADVAAGYKVPVSFIEAAASE